MYKILLLLILNLTTLIASQIGVVHGLDPNGDGFLSLRSSSKGAKLGNLYNGDRVIILDKKGKWYRVESLNSGQVGWSHGNWIKITNYSQQKNTDRRDQKSTPSTKYYSKLGFYKNTRFGFSGKYPKKLFTNESHSDNGDGVRLTNNDGTVGCSFYGSYNVLDSSIGKRYNEELISTKNSNGKEITYKVLRENWFATSGYDYTNRTIFYNKIFHTLDESSGVDIFTGFSLNYPIKDKQKYNKLVTTISENFEPYAENIKKTIEKRVKIDPSEEAYIDENVMPHMKNSIDINTSEKGNRKKVIKNEKRVKIDPSEEAYIDENVIPHMKNSIDINTSEKGNRKKVIKKQIDLSSNKLCDNKKDCIEAYSDYNNIAIHSDLPVKENLNYFLTPRNISGQRIFKIKKSALSAYEVGQEAGSLRNIRYEKFRDLYNINRTMIISVAYGEIDSTGFNEFEIDDFVVKLKQEFDKSILSIINDYRCVPKHIRIINLNIPIEYFKPKHTENIALVYIKDIKLLEKLNASSEPILLSDFIKQELCNNNISKYIKQNKEKFTFEAKVYYKIKNSFELNGLQIEADNRIINDIGKANKGNDTITELTLYVSNLETDNSKKTSVTNFAITSFKLKSSNKRFILNNSLKNIASTHYIKNVYSIQEDNALIKRK